MSKQYIKSSNEAPRLGLASIVLWFIAIDYFNWPEWTLGIWGLLSALLVGNFLYRLITEDGVDVVDRKDKS